MHMNHYDDTLPLTGIGFLTGIVALAGLGWVFGRTAKDTRKGEREVVLKESPVGVADSHFLDIELDDLLESDRTDEEKEALMNLLYQRHYDTEPRALICFFFSKFFASKRNYPESLKWARRCEELRRQLLDSISPSFVPEKAFSFRRDHALASLHVAIAHGKLGNFKKAEGYYLPALDFFFVNMPLTEQAYNAVGNYVGDLYSQGERQKLFQVINDYLKVIQKTKDQLLSFEEVMEKNRRIIGVHHLFAVFYFMLELYADSEEHLFLAIDHAKKKGIIPPGQLLCDAATVCYELGKSEKAEEIEKELVSIYGGERFPPHSFTMFATRSKYLTTRSCDLGVFFFSFFFSFSFSFSFLFPVSTLVLILSISPTCRG
eukprot:TRINITY_DN4144_c0_g2_i4.p1 TRINITY_DN4144_c0_g2~~TRINITY_DN4144_c0_g2_i4.p1  ORF type:complete len:374 (+),score=76.52 TRINITY_DN4144_c0_g2_i4:44-1165(+)